jgi:hypothetical protein
MAMATALVFVAVAVVSLGGSEEPTSAGVTTTPATTLPSTTSAPTTTTVADSTASSDTTSSTTSSTTTTETTTTTMPPTIVMREDGFGFVSADDDRRIMPFGTEAELALTTMTAVFGPPDEDSGWIRSFSGFGTCPGEEVRGIRWATLWLLMTDGETEWRSDGVPHLFAYLNSVFYDETQSLGLLTEDGIGLGDTVKELKDAYGKRVEITYEEFIDGYLFTIEVPPPGRMRGGLTGEKNNDLITAIDGGQGCGE